MLCHDYSVGIASLIAATGGVATGEDGPVFKAPWEAQAFAMVVSFQQKGLFTATEWADALSRCIRAAQVSGDPDSGDTYYLHWLRSLEDLIHTKSLLSEADLQRRQQEWRHAADTTPHGQEVVLLSSQRLPR